MVSGVPTTIDRSLPLRERKKLRTRQALADAALELFSARGFVETTLDDLVDAVEISKRTFFRTFASKEDVALAAELDLWDAYLAKLARCDARGPVLAMLRDALCEVLAELGDDWLRRFFATRMLATRTTTTVLRDHSEVLCARAQRRIFRLLEEKLAVKTGTDVRPRLLAELTVGAWRCGVRNWVSARSADKGPGGTRLLIRRVREAFDALPECLTLSAP